MARAYDVAYGYRDIPLECACLLEVYKRVVGRSAQSFLELAAGPAWHSIKMGGRGLASAALDLSPTMVRYGSEKAAKAGVALDYRLGDMVDFSWDRSFDLAAILLESTSYLLTNDDVFRHLQSVSHCLEPGGIYVQEMAHPRDVLGVGTSVNLDWESERDGLKVHMQWGQADDPFDPITQIADVTVVLEVEESGKKREVVERAPQRRFTATEWRGLIAASDDFDLVAQYGALDTALPFSNDDEAWRMVSVLQKTA